MERVHFQQEQMLLELKDLVDKNIFTEAETKRVMKKRTSFETALVRRVAKKADFLRYITYEMGLEQLRKKRIARLNLPPAPPTVSDHALVRRQFHIFERALKRFKSDVGLWLQYIQLAKREGARTLVGRITARALQFHPNKPALYIIAASHELDHLSPSAARTLLQRGIRMNPESVEMWCEYVRMELGFVESLRRRWDVLGISLAAKGEVQNGKGKANEAIGPSEQIGSGVLGAEELEDGEGEKTMQIELNEIGTETHGLDGDEGMAARRQIMQGEIVKSVITSAAEAIPKIGLFAQLKTIIAQYPSPPELRTALLEHLHSLVRSALPRNAEAIRLLADRHITPELRGVPLVDAVHRTNEELVEEVKSSGREEIFRVYADFVEDWCRRNIDYHMKLYLISSLQGVIQKTSGSASLFTAHIRVLTTLAETDASVAAKILRLAKKYSAEAPESSQVWLARLTAESTFEVGDAKGRASVVEIWETARQCVAGKEEEVLSVWMWGLGDGKAKLVGDKRKTHERLLKESMGDGSLRGVHEELLVRYVTVVHEAIGQDEGSDQTSGASAKWLGEVRRIGREYLTSSRVWQRVFSTVVEAPWKEGKYEVLGAVYSAWRMEEPEKAGITWCSWLGTDGRGAEAGGVARRLGREAADGWRAEMDKSR